MSLTTILSELWRFVKNNMIKIILGAILFGVVALFGGEFLTNIMNQPTAEEEVTTTETSNEETSQSRDYLTEVYSQEPANFEVFIQLADGNIFGNSFIFDEYFTSPEVIEEVENQSGIDYAETLKHEKNLQLYKTSDYRGSIAGIRNTSSNVITIRVQAGESSRENLRLAETFFDMITNNQIPFLEGLNVTVINDPSIGESLVGEDLTMVSSTASLGSFTPTETDSSSNLLYAVAGGIIGLFLTIAVLFIIQLFKKKINYAFQYTWDFADHHFLYSHKDENNDLKDILFYPQKEKPVLVAQNLDFAESLLRNAKIEYTDSLFNLNPESTGWDAIVLLIKSNETDKEWYNKQYQLAELQNTQITIVHILD